MASVPGYNWIIEHHKNYCGLIAEINTYAIEHISCPFNFYLTSATGFIEVLVVRNRESLPPTERKLNWKNPSAFQYDIESLLLYLYETRNNLQTLHPWSKIITGLIEKKMFRYSPFRENADACWAEFESGRDQKNSAFIYDATHTSKCANTHESISASHAIYWYSVHKLGEHFCQWFVTLAKRY